MQQGSNSALFLKGLMDNNISFRQIATETGRIFSYRTECDGLCVRVSVNFTEDDREVRITLSDFFYFDYQDTDKVLATLNDAPERDQLVACAIRDQVRVHKDICTASGFCAQTIFDTAQQMCARLKSLTERLKLIYSVLS